jgi:TonB family protein
MRIMPVVHGGIPEYGTFAASYRTCMKRITLVLVLLAVATICSAQTTRITYFKEMYGLDEVDEKKARFSCTVIKHDDGTETVTWKDIKRNEVVNAYRGDEPIDVWVSHWGGKDHVTDFDFKLEYAKRDCAGANNPATIKNYFWDDPAQEYVAPKIAGGEENIMKFLAKNLRYPSRARRMGIQGTVFLHMTITKDAKIENIVVTEGVEVGLDKEAVRIMRKLQLTTPPMVKGQPIEACVVFPIRFKLAN